MLFFFLLLNIYFFLHAVKELFWVVEVTSLCSLYSCFPRDYDSLRKEDVFENNRLVRCQDVQPLLRGADFIHKLQNLM